MSNTSHARPLGEAVSAIADFNQYIPLSLEMDDGTQSLVQEINDLLKRLSGKYDLSAEEANSLAAGTIRLVVMADVQERLGQADKNVKNASDLKSFFEEVLVDFKDATGAQVGIYVSLDGVGNPKSMLASGIDDVVKAEVKNAASFRQVLAEVYVGKNVVCHPGVQGDGVPILIQHSMLIAPVSVRDKTTGMFVMMSREDVDAFNRDDLSMLEQLLPDVTRVLERLDLLRALEHSNTSLHVEQVKQKALIDQLETAQSQLMQSEKMASVGQLAAGVAHEINNPIGFVYSNLGTLEKYLVDLFRMVDSYEAAENAISDSAVLAQLQSLKSELDLSFLKEDLPALMAESRDGITRVKKIVQDLKDFSHVDVVEEWEFADLQRGIDTTLNIVSNEVKYKADVIKEYGDIPEVECLSSQLNQVFMNLLVNAAHAIEEHGTITIRTGQDGDSVWVEVEDTGKGVTPENLTRIFDPFFTTKAIGKGTGLGLSMAYGIIQKHQGKIDVRSEVGKGTAFRVVLPLKRQVA